MYHGNSSVSSAAILSLTGSSEQDGAALDTAAAGLEALMIHIRAEIASGTPDTATLTWALQESVDGSTSWTACDDNSGAAIGGTVNVHTTAQDIYARVEGLGLSAAVAGTRPGGRVRYLRIALTPAFTNGSSPAILAYAEYIAVTGNGVNLPVRTTVSNT